MLAGKKFPGAGFILAVVVLTAVAFWPISRNDFVGIDDEDYITRNSVVKRGLTAQGVALAFTRSYAANWHPLTWISHMLDVDLFGLDPRGHHLVSLAIHLATALLLMSTLRAMTGRAGPSFLVAVLFAVHPLHVESVAWAAERKDVLSACFWMLATAMYLRYVRRPRAGRYLLVLLFFSCGLMAKPMVVTLPFVLLLLDFWPLGRHRSGTAAGEEAPLRRLAALTLEKIPLLALSVLSSLVTIKAQAAGGAVLSLAAFPLEARVANALLSTVNYIGKTLWPFGLAVFYPFGIHPLMDSRVLAAGALLVAVSAAVMLLHRRHPWLLTGWCWYLVTLLPVIGLIQVGEQAMADRYTYLPLIGIFVAASWELEFLARRRVVARRVLAGGAAFVVLLLAWLTQRQTAFWRDSETLFGHAARVTSGNWKAVYNLGLAREAAGDRAGAIALYREAFHINPGLAKARYAYALALDEEGRSVEAIGELRAAVASRPADPVIRMSLALLLTREGRDEEAIATLRELVARNPNVAEGYNNLAVLLTRRGRLDEAAALLRRALVIDPAYDDARINLEALTGKQPKSETSTAGEPAVPTTHRGLIGGAPAR